MDDSDKYAEFFAPYYLQRATTELADDLAKIRHAEDFKPGSLWLLIRALHQGSATFSPGEQKRIVTGGRTEQVDQQSANSAEEKTSQRDSN
jgi:hypothetical protein